MKMGIIISTNEAESVYNAFRFGNFSLKNGHEVSVFLLGRGVECNEIKNESFNVEEQIESFIGNKGCVLACGSCMKLRKKEETGICPISTMKDLLKLVEESDKVVTFG